MRTLKTILTTMVIFLAIFKVSAQSQLDLHLSLNSDNGVYAIGDTIKVYASSADEFAELLSVRVDQNGTRIYTNKFVQISDKEPVLVYSNCFSKPCSINISVGYDQDKKSSRSIGCVISPESFKPGYTEPSDLMKFWENQINNLRKMAIDVKTVEVEHKYSEKYVCYDVEISMPEGNPVRGYMAMPRNASPGTLPIALLPHAAGVSKPHCLSSVKAAVEWAKKGKGVIAFDINAHGLPNGQTAEYYEEIEKTTLNGYQKRPLVSHEEFYFRLMYLRLVRAMDYLTSLSEWDGKRVLVRGESQGAGQAGAIAALDSRVRMAVMNVPALCDLGGLFADHRGGWPGFYSKKVKNPETKSIYDSILPYYDVALLIKYTKAALVIECGFIDTTCPPESVYSAYNNALNAVSKTLLTYPRRTHYRVEQKYYDEWSMKVGDVRDRMIEDYLR